MISLIAAIDQHNGIGFKGKIPWHIPEDFKYFKNITSGKPVIMGLTTYWSLPEKNRPLPGRDNLVLCDNDKEAKKIKGAKVFSSIESVIEYCNNFYKDKECFVIGGASIYKQFILYADKLYLTIIDKVFESDAFFPEFINDWVEIKTTHCKQEELLKYTFSVFDKIEKCVYCGSPTIYTKSDSISKRNYYVDGAGQLCSSCFTNIYNKS